VIVTDGAFHEMDAGRCLRNLPAHSDPVTAAHFCRDGTLVVSGSYDGICRIWDAATGQCLKTLIGEESAPVSFVKFCPNGKYIAVCTLDSTIRLWNYSVGRVTKTFRGHKNDEYCITSDFLVLDDKAWIVGSSEDGKVVVWDINERNIVQTLDAHTDVVMAVNSHPSQPQLTTCSADNTIKIWQHAD